MSLAEISVECRAYNSASDEVARETRLISVIRPPGRPSLQVEGVGDVVAGGQLVVKCSSAGGNPHPGVTIYKGHEKLLTEVTVDGRVTRARAVTEVTASDNGAKVSCHVTNPATDIPLVANTAIELFFPPWEAKAWVSPTNVSAGQVAKLICESSSSLPASSITWRSGSVTNYGATSMNRPGLYGGQVTRSELEVRALIEDNQRTYICDATNGLGVTVTTNVTLNVLHEPVWKDVPSGVVEVREKDDLLLKAVADANPPPVTYKWWRGPVLIQEDQEEGGGLLEMKRVHRQEAGGYSVTAESPRGVVNASFVINVLYGPESIMAPKRVTVDEDGSTVITCSAIGNPTPNITWFTQDNDSSIREVLSWGVSEARLLIDFVTRADTGFYKCLASNVVESARPIKTAVVVTQAPEPLEEVASREDAPSRPWAKVGGTGRLECFVKAAPAPNFRWTINEDRVLFNSRKYFVRGPHLMDGLAEWSSVLEIRSVTSRDYTTYTCTASNYKGAYTSNHTLGPPIPPHQPYNLSVASVIGSTAILTWIPPSHGTTPSGYTIRYRPLHDEEYLRQNVAGRGTTTVKIQGLSPGATYEFAVQTYNSQGTSDFTSPSTKVAIPGVVEEVASSSSQPRVPRLTLLLMSLTGAALLVLNISIIICFIRRFALSRNTPASSYKTAISETYTPASTPAMITDDDEEEKTGGPEIVTSTSQYQLTRQSSIRKRRDRGSPRDNKNKIIHHYNTDIVETSKPQDGLQPTILIPSPQFVTIDSPTNQSKSALMNGGLNLRSHGPSNPKTEPAKYNDFVTDDGRHLDDNISKRTKADAQDIPDVCPKSSGSGGSLLRQESQEGPCQEDDRVSLASHHSNTSYVNLPDHGHGIGRQTSVGLRRQGSLSPTPVGLRRHGSMSPTPRGLRNKDRMSPTPMGLRRQGSLSPTPSLPPILSSPKIHRNPIPDHSQEPRVPSPSTFCPNKTSPHAMLQGHLHPGLPGCLHHRGYHHHHHHHHHGIEKQQQEHHHQNLEQQGRLEFHQGLPLQETERGATQYRESEPREFHQIHQAGPYCHQGQHGNHQQTASNQMHFQGYQGRPYPQQNTNHNVPLTSSSYGYPSSEYHLPAQHPQFHYHHPVEESPRLEHPVKVGSEPPPPLPNTGHSPVLHTQREYQYTIPFTEEAWRGGYPQPPTTEQHQLQCIREEPSNDPAGVDGKSCTAETTCDVEGRGMHEQTSEGTAYEHYTGFGNALAYYTRNMFLYDLNLCFHYY
ncbi:nephrin-like [Macrobrachium nipponense]|uniref:nephrin-like n=1 Tax=Macrobrachium nipponense TaxID=159736 RepID=UPI0030C7BADD